MNIVLVGYRGTGKSAIARLLCRELDRNVFSLDGVLAERAGKSIPEIVREDGWERFRQMESDLVAEATNRETQAIIDCGGGVVLDDCNIQNLRRNGKIVWLTADLETVMKRIKADPNRPALKEGLSFEEEQKQVLEEREELYRACSDMKIDTSQGSPYKAVRRIVFLLKKNDWL